MAGHRRDVHQVAVDLDPDRHQPGAVDVAAGRPGDAGQHVDDDVPGVGHQVVAPGVDDHRRPARALLGGGQKAGRALVVADGEGDVDARVAGLVAGDVDRDGDDA